MTPITSDHDWLAFVAGRAQGANAILIALAETHPDPARLLAEIEKAEQAALATIEQTTMPEQFLEGMRDVIDRVITYLRQRRARA